MCFTARKVPAVIVVILSVITILLGIAMIAECIVFQY